MEISVINRQQLHIANRFLNPTNLTSSPWRTWWGKNFGANFLRNWEARCRMSFFYTVVVPAVCLMIVTHSTDNSTQRLSYTSGLHVWVNMYKSKLKTKLPYTRNFAISIA